MSGYYLRKIDLDTIFEPLAPGDNRYPQDTGYYSETGVDAKDKYAPLALGARYLEDVGHARLGTDLRDIFAALGSVPRFNPLPWLSNPGPKVTPTIYRQPSRALLTKVDLVCRILEDGRCEITAQSPDIHSNPNNRLTDVIYGLSDAPIWDASKVPADVDYEVCYELVSGTGWSIDGGIGFGVWTRLTSGHPGTTLRGQLVYNHSVDAGGNIVQQPKVNILLRRTDYPNSNKISGVVTANLTLNVSPSLFSTTTSWAKTIASVNNAATNYHNPDGNTGSFKASTKVEFNTDGTILFYTLNQSGTWVQVLSSRWRRDDAETSITDYDVLCEVTDLVGNGTVGNPITTWTQVTAGYVIIFESVYTNNTAPGTYVATRTLNLSIRQRSTRGYREAGIVLPDNFVTGQIRLSNTVQIKPPLLLNWPSTVGWSGSFTEAKTVTLQPGISGNLSELIKLTFNASGTVEVSSSQKVLGNGTWLPAGVSPGEIEMRSIMTASGTTGGNATGSESDAIATNWISFASGSKVLQSAISITPIVSAAYREYTGIIQMRRKSYPSDMVTIPLTIRPQVEYTAPAALPWPSTAWAGTHAYKYSLPFTPETPNTVTESIGVYFSSTGDVYVDRSLHGPGDNARLSAGRWLPPGSNVNDIEILVSGNFTGDAGTDTNQLSAWTQVLTGAKYLLTQVSRNSAVSGLGVSQRNFTGTISLRRKSYPSDIVTFAINITPGAEVAAPIAPDWSGMTLPDLIYTVNKDLNMQQPNRFESAGVRYVMGISTSTTAKNVVGYNTYDTQIGATADGIDSDVAVVNTRITPEGWDPSKFEWAFRVLSGEIDTPNPGVWRGMDNAAYNVQLTVTTNHGMGAGTFKKTGVVAIDVRRKAYPSHSFTFTCKFEPSVVIVQNGPAWGSIVIPATFAQAESLVGLTYPSNVCAAGSGFVIGNASADVNNFHIDVGTAALNWDSNSNEINPLGRLIPTGWNPNDFEWKYDVVSLDPGGYIADAPVGDPAATIAVAGQWNAFNVRKSVAYYSPRGITVSAPTTQSQKAVINLTIKHKTNVNWGYTYQNLELTTRIDWVNPTLTLWPRENYQNWAGTYNHTTEVEVKQSYGTWASTWDGNTTGQNAIWKFAFSPDGTWSWTGNGLATDAAEGRWAAAPTSGGSYSIRATGVANFSSTTNITSAWQTLAAEKYISFAIARPPAGEVDNTGGWRGTVEIRNDITGEITSGLLSVNAYSWR